MRLRIPPPNPVLVREVRQRMRGPRAAVVLTLYLGVLTFILKLVADATMRSPMGGVRCINGDCFPIHQENVLAASTAGRPISHTILLLMLVLVCFIVPALGAGAIAGERDRQTLVPLQLTLLTSRSLLVGKLLAALAFVVLLIAASLPLFTIAFWVGGVTLTDVLKGLAMVLATSVLLTAVGLFTSAHLKRSVGATVTAYGIVFILTAGTFMIYGAQEASRNLRPGPQTPTSPAVLLLNPFVATADVLGGTLGAAEFTSSPFTGIRSMLYRDQWDGMVMELRHVDADGIAQGPPGPLVPYWLRSLVLFALLTLAAVGLAARRIRTPSGRPDP